MTQSFQSACYWAASRGHIECLKYAHENGCPWNEDTSFWAAFNREGSGYNGQFEECLVYLYDNGCPGDEYTYENVNRCRFMLELRRKAKRNT